MSLPTAVGAAAGAGAYFPYGDNIILPPRANQSSGHTIPITLMIDSEQRDKTLYPDASDYYIDLPTTLNDVASIELIYAKIPNIHYNITEYNNKFVIQETTDSFLIQTRTTIILTPGEYSLTTLTTSLQDNLNNANLSHSYNITYNATTRKIVFGVIFNPTSVQPSFALRFDLISLPYECNLQLCNGSMQLVLGYPANSYITLKRGTISGTSGGNVITGIGTMFTQDFSVGDPFVIGGQLNIPYTIESIINDTTLTVTDPIITTFTDQFISATSIQSVGQASVAQPNYIIMYVNDYDIIDSNNTYARQAFTTLATTNNEDYIIIDTSRVQTQREIKHFNPPVRLSRLHIYFRYPSGIPYSFYGLEHALKFSVKLMNYNTSHSP